MLYNSTTHHKLPQLPLKSQLPKPQLEKPELSQNRKVPKHQKLKKPIRRRPDNRAYSFRRLPTATIVTNSHVPLMSHPRTRALVSRCAGTPSVVCTSGKGQHERRCKRREENRAAHGLAVSGTRFKSCHGLIASLQAPLTCFFHPATTTLYPAHSDRKKTVHEPRGSFLVPE